MKFTIVAAAAAALSLAAAGPAAAQPAGHPGQHRSALPQVTGSRLQTGLLPASAFGAGFTVTNTLNTGGALKPARVTLKVLSASCSTFEGEIYVSGFGNTAGALDQYVNPDAAVQLPEAIIDGFQDVIQFATAGAATNFFNQAYAKYLACRSFSEPNPADTNPGGGTFQISALSVSGTAVSGDQAFTVTQEFAPSETPGHTKYINVLYAVAGLDAYSMWEESGTNDEPSPALMGQLIRRIQALYPR